MSGAAGPEPGAAGPGQSRPSLPNNQGSTVASTSSMPSPVPSPARDGRSPSRATPSQPARPRPPEPHKETAITAQELRALISNYKILNRQMAKLDGMRMYTDFKSKLDDIFREKCLPPVHEMKAIMTPDERAKFDIMRAWIKWSEKKKLAPFPICGPIVFDFLQLTVPTRSARQQYVAVLDQYRDHSWVLFDRYFKLPDTMEAADQAKWRGRWKSCVSHSSVRLSEWRAIPELVLEASDAPAVKKEEPSSPVKERSETPVVRPAQTASPAPRPSPTASRPAPAPAAAPAPIAGPSSAAPPGPIAGPSAAAAAEPSPEPVAHAAPAPPATATPPPVKAVEAPEPVAAGVEPIVAHEETNALPTPVSLDPSRPSSAAETRPESSRTTSAPPPVVDPVGQPPADVARAASQPALPLGDAAAAAQEETITLSKEHLVRLRDHLFTMQSRDQRNAQTLREAEERSAKMQATTEELQAKIARLEAEAAGQKEKLRKEKAAEEELLARQVREAAEVRRQGQPGAVQQLQSIHASQIASQHQRQDSQSSALQATEAARGDAQQKYYSAQEEMMAQQAALQQHRHQLQLQQQHQQHQQYPPQQQHPQQPQHQQQQQHPQQPQHQQQQQQQQAYHAAVMARGNQGPSQHVLVQPGPGGQGQHGRVLQGQQGPQAQQGQGQVQPRLHPPTFPAPAGSSRQMQHIAQAQAQGQPQSHAQQAQAQMQGMAAAQAAQAQAQMQMQVMAKMQAQAAQNQAQQNSYHQGGANTQGQQVAPPQGGQPHAPAGFFQVAPRPQAYQPYDPRFAVAAATQAQLSPQLVTSPVLSPQNGQFSLPSPQPSPQMQGVQTLPSTSASRTFLPNLAFQQRTVAIAQQAAASMPQVPSPYSATVATPTLPAVLPRRSASGSGPSPVVNPARPRSAPLQQQAHTRSLSSSQLQAPAAPVVSHSLSRSTPASANVAPPAQLQPQHQHQPQPQPQIQPQPQPQPAATRPHPASRPHPANRPPSSSAMPSSAVTGTGSRALAPAPAPRPASAPNMAPPPVASTSRLAPPPSRSPAVPRTAEFTPEELSQARNDALALFPGLKESAQPSSSPEWDETFRKLQTLLMVHTSRVLDERCSGLKGALEEKRAREEEAPQSPSTVAGVPLPAPSVARPSSSSVAGAPPARQASTTVGAVVARVQHPGRPAPYADYFPLLSGRGPESRSGIVLCELPVLLPTMPAASLVTKPLPALPHKPMELTPAVPAYTLFLNNSLLNHPVEAQRVVNYWKDKAIHVELETAYVNLLARLPTMMAPAAEKESTRQLLEEMAREGLVGKAPPMAASRSKAASTTPMAIDGPAAASTSGAPPVATAAARPATTSTAVPLPAAPSTAGPHPASSTPMAVDTKVAQPAAPKPPVPTPKPFATAQLPAPPQPARPTPPAATAAPSVVKAATQPAPVVKVATQPASGSSSFATSSNLGRAIAPAPAAPTQKPIVAGPVQQKPLVAAPAAAAVQKSPVATSSQKHARSESPAAPGPRAGEGGAPVAKKAKVDEVAPKVSATARPMARSTSGPAASPSMQNGASPSGHKPPTVVIAPPAVTTTTTTAPAMTAAPVAVAPAGGAPAGPQSLYDAAPSVVQRFQKANPFARKKATS